MCWWSYTSSYSLLDVHVNKLILLFGSVLWTAVGIVNCQATVLACS